MKKSGNVKLKKIINRGLDEFAENLIYLIASDSLERLGKIIHEAKKEYDNRQGIFTQVVNLCSGNVNRSSEFDEFSDNLITFPGEYNRLQNFQRFILNGKWKTTSKNTFMMIKLINAVEGYEPETPKYLHDHIIEPLQNRVKIKVTEKIQDYTLEVQKSFAKKQELALSAKKKLESLQDAKLFSCIDKANKEALNKPGILCFVLADLANNTTRSNFTLHWCSPAGKAYKLTINDSLRKKLNQWKVNYTDWDDSTTLSIKKELISALDVFLSRVKVSINPGEMERRNATNTFLLDNSGIQWLSGTGEANVIDMKSNDLLREWLKKNTKEESAEQLRILKSLLINFETRRPLDDACKNKIEDVLKKRLQPTGKEASKKDEEVVCRRLDLTKFKFLEDFLLKSQRNARKKPNDAQQDSRPIRHGKINFEAYAAIANCFNGTFFQEKSTSKEDAQQKLQLRQ